MFKTPGSAAPEKHNPRLLSLGGLMLFIWAITEVNNGFEFHDTWSAIFWLVSSPLVAWIWVGWTMVCLRNLGLRRLWVLPILLPPLALLAAFYKKWKIAGLVVLVIMIVVQIAIVLRKPARDLKPLKTSDSDRLTS